MLSPIPSSAHALKHLHPPLVPTAAVALVLGFVGAKILADYGGLHVPTGASLAVVASILTVGVGASLALPAPPPKSSSKEE